MDGTITRSTYDEADLTDPRVIDIIDKISVREDPALTAEMPSLANICWRLEKQESMEPFFSAVALPPA
jgi:2-methylcitrate dehydratase PrpD